MARHYIGIAVLFLAVAVAPAVLELGRRPAAAVESQPPDIPPEALEALRQGRYWRASRILRGYLAAVPDPGPETILLAAQAEAGWGAWARVDSLLAGRDWLDRVSGGYGWNLLGRSRLELEQWLPGEEALQRYLDVAADAGERQRGMAEMRRARALEKAGDAAGAVAAYDRAARLLPQLGDWIAIFATEALAAAGDTAAVRRRLAGVDSVLALDWGWRIRYRAQQQAGDIAGAQRVAELAATRLGRASARAEAWTAAGRARLQRGDTAGAREAFIRAMEAAPGATAAVDAARELSGMRGATPRDLLRAGRVYLRHGNLDRGIAGLRAYLASGRGSALERAEIRLEVGRALFRAGRYADAERWMLDLAAEAPNPRIGAEAMLVAGRAQYRRGREEAGRATLLRTATRFPGQRAAAEAVYLVADLAHDDGDLARARELYRRTVEIDAAAREAGLALMRLAGMAYVEGDREGAARIWEEYRQRHPNGRNYQQATFWAARAHRGLGRDSLARARLREVRRVEPLSYYGIRAAELLGENLWNMPLEPSPPQQDSVEGEVARALVRLDLLRDLGYEEAADFEVGRLRRHFDQRDGALYALAEAFNARGFTITGIRLGWEIYEREGAWNLRLLRIIYPFPYRDMIVAEAAERGLDPFLVAGLIRQESMFNPAIASPAGAIGLMQIMPATGRALARRTDLGRFDAGLLERPEVNLHLGTAYFADLIERFGNRLTAALAAYNAGPHRVSRWRDFPEYEDEELFAERIPYAETRQYVKVVQQNARIYAALYGGPASGAATGD
ncbi:MAG TPA: transglycosylase SLT domain-containing protein [Longimicrobiales bacterium]